MNKKLRIILITSLALVALVLLLGALPALAAEPKAEHSGLDNLSDACASAGLNFFMPANLGLCASYFFARIAYLFVQFASWLLWAIAKLFNMVLVIQNGAFHNQPMVNVGWIIARDVANIFYIFFLLIISIATIIRYDSYGMKTLLWKLIVSALLVNFSLPIAGLIIDFSNALGNTFYINMSTSEDREIGNFAKNPDGTIDTTHKTLDISTTLISGFHPSKLLMRAPDAPKPAASELADTLIDIIIAEIFAIILIVVVSIVLVAAMAMLITRIVVLWFVLILAPFAFLFWVLPKTSSISGEWFETLFKHAFFYPAFMFTLYISITAIKYGVIAKMVNADKDGLAGAMFSNSQWAATGASLFTQKIQLILNFAILTMFVVGGLLVAQKMSISGAGAATAASKYLAGKGKSLGNRALYESALRPAGWASEKVSNTAVGRALARVPLARQALRVPGAAIQKRDAERAKMADQQATRVKGLEPRAAASLMTTLNARGKAKAFETMDEKQKARTVQEMNTSQQVAFAKSIHSTDPNKDYERQVAIASGSVEQAMKILHGDEKPVKGKTSDAETKMYQDNVDKYVKSLGEKDLAKLRKGTIEGDQYFQRAAIKNKVDTEKLQNSHDIIDPDAREAFENLTKEINSVAGSIKILHGVEAPPGTYDPKAPTSEQQAYQKLVNDRVSNMDEKQLTKLKPDSINNPYFEDVMFKSFSANDMRRVAQTGENANAIKESLERKVGKTGKDLEDFLDGVLPDAEFEKLSTADRAGKYKESDVSRDYLINTNLLKLMKSAPARSLIVDGTPLSRRDVNTGQFAAPGAPPATPPAAPPPAP
ncbi:MAG: hypothetical protein AAB417_01890 [Patescibacteria group bacterium]